MYTFYKQNPLGFALSWIGIYVVSLSAADTLSQSLGMEKSVTAALSLAMTAFLYLWVKQHALLQTYGLAQMEAKQLWLHYWPLLLLISTNLWGGVQLHHSVPETVLYMLSMLCVGFLEELIFRGFLFRAICRENVKTAILVSSITFGVGHIVNLLNGADLLPTLLQIVYAIAAGLLFTVIVYRWGSLWPCIITHSILNALSAVAGPRSQTMDYIAAAFLTVVALAYAAWIWKSTEKEA